MVVQTTGRREGERWITFLTRCNERKWFLTLLLLGAAQIVILTGGFRIQLVVYREPALYIEHLDEEDDGEAAFAERKPTPVRSVQDVEDTAISIAGIGDLVGMESDHLRYSIGSYQRFAIAFRMMAIKRSAEYAHFHRKHWNLTFPSNLCVIPTGTNRALGNFLFILASSLGIAITNQRNLVVTEWDPKFGNFLPTFAVDPHTPQFSRELLMANSVEVASLPGVYNTKTEDLSIDYPGVNVVLRGYMQSWKYFDRYRDEVRRQLAFRRHIYEQAANAVLTEITGFFNQSGLPSFPEYPVLIGVHVRRGDMLEKDQLEHGHKTATEEYLLKAVLRMYARYPKAVFIVVSNDTEYCKNLFSEMPLRIAAPSSAFVDMAILTLMDHLILSIGSFGWWGAYMSNAKEVYYYKDWPRRGSEMARIFRHGDYFRPQWTPLAR